MAQRNIEIVRLVTAAFSSGDIEAALELIDPAFETAVGPELSAEPDVYRGHDGIRRYFDSFREAMDEIRFDADDLRDAGRSVIAAVRLSARGRVSGIAVEQRLGQVWTVRGGRALRLHSYASHQEALRAAAGAETGAGSPEGASRARAGRLRGPVAGAPAPATALAAS